MNFNKYNTITSLITAMVTDGKGHLEENIDKIVEERFTNFKETLFNYIEERLDKKIPSFKVVVHINLEMLTIIAFERKLDEYAFSYDDEKYHIYKIKNYVGTNNSKFDIPLFSKSGELYTKKMIKKLKDFGFTEYDEYSDNFEDIYDYNEPMDDDFDIYPEGKPERTPNSTFYTYSFTVKKGMLDF